MTVEVIVVDNGSSDASREVASRHPAVTRVVTESRPGSYAARNAGLAVAAGDLIAFTDADCIPASDWLRQGFAAVARDLDLVAGHVSPRVSDEPSLWERFDAGHHVDQRKYVEVLGFGATANLFVRRHVLDGIGAFDAAMASGGDRELCRRAVTAGFRAGLLAATRSSPTVRGALPSRPGGCIGGSARACASFTSTAYIPRGGATTRCACRSVGPPRWPATRRGATGIARCFPLPPWWSGHGRSDG